MPNNEGATQRAVIRIATYMHHENSTHGRHHEKQRTAVTKWAMGVYAALAAWITRGETHELFSKESAAAAVFLALFAGLIYHLVSQISARAHEAQTKAGPYRRELANIFKDENPALSMALGALENQHQELQSRHRPGLVTNAWMALHFFIFVIALIFA